MRIVFTHAQASDTHQSKLQSLLEPHDTEFRQGAVLPLGPVAYVAHADEHAERYNAVFPGSLVRLRGRLRASPVPECGAVYIPVSYESWLVACDGAAGFGAALETARLLKDVRTVVCPVFGDGDLHALELSLASAHHRWHDTVFRA